MRFATNAAMPVLVSPRMSGLSPVPRRRRVPRIARSIWPIYSRSPLPRTPIYTSGLANLELPKEEATQAVVVVLTCVYKQCSHASSSTSIDCGESRIISGRVPKSVITFCI